MISLNRSAPAIATMAVATAFCCGASDSVSGDADTLAQREQRIASFSASQKEELQRRRDRFDKLPAAEKERMRTLHQRIQEHEDSERLLTVLDRYAEWLRTVSTPQRADLRKLSGEERIQRIRETKRRREEERFGRFMSERLHPEDARRVFDWLDDEFVTGEQERRLERMIDARDRRWLQVIDDDSRRRALMLKMLYRKNPDVLGVPSPEQINELVKRLSPEARRQFEAQANSNQQEKLVQDWIQAAIMSRLAPPPVSDEELEAVFASLSTEQRTELERLPRDRMQRELSRIYHMRNMVRRRGGPPGQGPPGRFRPRGRGDRDHDRGRGGRDRRRPTDFDPQQQPNPPGP